MIRILLLLLLPLSLAAPAAAWRDVPYEYESVIIADPVTVTGVGCTERWIALPPGVEGLMGPPYLKSCEVLGGASIEDDAFVHLHLQRRHPDKYRVRVKVCDLLPGRTQTYCPRLPYTVYPTHHE